MAIDRQSQEELLYAWMQMSVCIRGNRILTTLSFNEIMLCGLLYRQETSGGPPLTATDLGEQMKLLKSQVNHILTTLEQGGLVQRARGTEDRRTVHVHLTETGRLRYLKEHALVMELVQQVCDGLGEEDTRRLAALISKATGLVTKLSER